MTEAELVETENGLVPKEGLAALRHGAGVEQETSVPAEAYSRIGPSRLARYREGWLPSDG
jgi:hypothetical protein